MKKRISKALIFISIFSAANYLLFSALLGDGGFLMGRIVISIGGGWYIYKNVKPSLSLSSLAGITMLVVDHIILKGGSFLIMQQFWPETINNLGYDAFMGVIISFIMFSPIAAFVSVIGGLIARKS